MSRLILVTFVSSFLWLLTVSISHSDDDLPKSDQEGAVPTFYETAMINIVDDRKQHVRSLPVFSSETKDGTVYSVLPEFSLVENPTPLAGLPNIVWKLIPKSGGRSTLVFKIRRNSLLQQQVAIQKLDTDKSVRFERFPLVEVFVALTDGDGELIANMATPLHVKQASDILEIRLSLGKEQLKKIQVLFDNDELRFSISYRFSGNRQETARSKTTVSAKLANEIEQKLRKGQDQGPGKNAISARTVDEIKFELSTALKQEIFATNPKLIVALPSQTTQLIAALLEKEPMTFEAFAQKYANGDTQRALEEYIVPLIKQHFDSSTSDKREVRTHTKQSGKSTTIGAGVAIMGIGANAAKTKHEADINSIQKSTGITLTKSESGEYFVPTTITLYHMKKGADLRRLVEEQFIDLQGDRERSFIRVSPIPQSFTAAICDASYQRTVHSLDTEQELKRVKKELEEAQSKIENFQQILFGQRN